MKKIIFILPGLLLVIAAIIFFRTDYSSFIYILKTQNPEIYDAKIIESYISKSGFDLLKLSFLLVTASLLILLWILAQKKSELIYSIFGESKYLVQKIINIYKSLKTLEKFLILTSFIIVVIHRILFIHKLPFSSDETFSYIFFVKQDFWISAIYYPEPNNHIFYNLIVNFFDLFISDPVLCMRLPALIIYIITLFIIFVFTHKKFGFATAITAFILCAFTFSAAFYSIQGRGYILLAFFSILASISVYEFCETRKKIFFVIFILSSILGAYTIPVFLFPFLSMIAYAFIFGDRWIRKNILYGALVAGISVLILYLPIIALNGLDALTGNRWVKANDINYLVQILPAAIAESIDYVLGVNKKGYLIAVPFILLCIYFYFNKKSSDTERKWIAQFFISLICAFIIIIALRHFPPYRVWTYLVYLFNIALAIILIKIISLFIENPKWKNIAATLLLIPYACYMIGSFKPLPEQVKFFNQLNLDVNSIYQSSPSSIYIDKHDYLEQYLRLKYINVKRKIEIDMIEPEPNKSYDYLIIYEMNPKILHNKGYIKISEFDNAVILKKAQP